MVALLATALDKASKISQAYCCFLTTFLLKNEPISLLTSSAMCWTGDLFTLVGMIGDATNLRPPTSSPPSSSSSSEKRGSQISRGSGNTYSWGSRLRSVLIVWAPLQQTLLASGALRVHASGRVEPKLSTLLKSISGALTFPVVSSSLKSMHWMAWLASISSVPTLPSVLSW